MDSLKAILKSLLRGVCLVLVFPCALTAGFGRVAAGFTFWAQALALLPGLPGDYLRVAFYCLTLERCHPESRIQFGSFFAHSAARVGKGVYIGTYCVFGRVHIGERTQIGSAVQVLSGRSQHPRDASGRILGSHQGAFTTIHIGSDCWLGAQAIVMADVGDATTIGAGSVVVHEIPPASVAVGNPARLISRPVHAESV